MARTRRGESLPRWLVERRQAVGEALRARRQAFGISRRELARMSGVSFLTIGRLERGETGSDETYHLLAESLVLPADWQIRPEALDPTDTGPVANPVDEALSLLVASGELGPNALRAIRAVIRLARTSPKAEFHAGWVAAGLQARLDREGQDSPD